MEIEQIMFIIMLTCIVILTIVCAVMAIYDLNIRKKIAKLSRNLYDIGREEMNIKLEIRDKKIQKLEREIKKLKKGEKW